MSRYEFSLLQEVLLEKGAGVLGDLSRYKRQNRIEERTHPVAILYSLVWNAKQDILSAKSKEELDHAYEMIDFVIKRNGNVEIGQINVVPTAWGSVLEVFEHVYQHECHVSKLIDDLLDVAIKENDKAAQNFINKFVDEQVEEESTAQTIVDRIKMMNGHNLIYLDDKLGERQ